MGSIDIRVSPLLSYVPLLYLVISRCCTATDTITSNQSIIDGETLVSAGGIFELGFFKPGNSPNRYVGVWYKNISDIKVVWVLNRMKPLKDSSGVLAIGKDGNLMLLDGRQNVIWSTEASVTSNNSVAVLQDSGNFMLTENGSDGRVLWQSFDHPSDTLLPTMKIGENLKTGKKRYLNSWKSKDDPSPGNFSLTSDNGKLLQGFIMNGSVRYWRTGQWNGQSFVGIPDMTADYLNGIKLISDDETGMLYFTYSTTDKSGISFFMLDSSGNLKQTGWDEENKGWVDFWFSLNSQCDVYGTCGPFGSCNNLESPICSCMGGRGRWFQPRFPEEWRKGNWTGGCVRRTQLQCQENNTSSGKGKEDGFRKLEGIKLPDFADYLEASDERECHDICLKNCSCLAYAQIHGPGCMVWGKDLIDVQMFSSGGEELFLRLASSELGKSRHKMILIISLVTVLAVVSMGAFAYVLCRWKAKERGTTKKMPEVFDLGKIVETSTESPQASMLRDSVKQVENQDLQIFDFCGVAIATNNFSAGNKLGEGGFGPVYKGKLPTGQEIAIKRLSRSSAQGIEEFKNEVMLISKLQHRNLVKLVGCCIEAEEKILLYEYMPNKSLDAILFDTIKRAQLDWTKRFIIIEGIARGLLYLHRDSRLRVIHRDLKPSNILLDEDMNPKISDFGMARIFGGKQALANTNRVVGTYGYMSPEYAMEGIFSEKSDVFSFGVLLLEIVSSKKNTSFNHHEQPLNLLSYAWRLWKEGKGVELIDQTLVDSCSPQQVMRCIHIGLLCVQESAVDRPSMSTILFMLSSEITLPTPKQPAFILERNRVELGSSSHSNDICSINEVSMTVIEGR